MTQHGMPAERPGFTAERRRALLDEYIALVQRLDELDDLIEAASPADAVSLTQEEDRAWERLSRLRDTYEEEVPVPPLSRCPFTGQALHHSFDHLGLDGLWWNHEAPVRPLQELPATYFALTGAVRLLGAPAWAPFLCAPGPEAPYVVPRILAHPVLRAVLSSVRVGEHQGYAVVYFADPIPRDLRRVNTWGTNEYEFRDEGGDLRWDTEPANPDERDFNLEPWIAARKLLWIAPADLTLTLRDTVAGCPYVALDGRRDSSYIRQGQVWW